MAVDALVTTYTGDGGTGAKTITVTGVTPKLAIAWGNATTGTNQADALAFIGAATSSSERGAVLYGSSDAVANERAGAQVATTVAYREAAAPGASAFATNSEYDLTSFGANAININVTDAFTTRHNILALGGADIEAEVVNFTLDSASSTKTVSLSRLTTSQVKAVILMFVRPRTSAGTSTGAGAAGLCIGMTDGTNQGCFITQLEDLADPTDTRSATYNNKLYTFLDDTGAVTDQGTISSLGTGQFVISQGTRANNYIGIAIAICGTCQVAVGAYNQPSSATTQALGFSFTPKALFAISDSSPANTVTDGARFMIGAASSTSADAAISGLSSDNQATTIAKTATVTNKIIRHGSDTSPLADADLSDMNTLNWTTADATARTTIILAIGDAAAGGTDTLSPNTASHVLTAANATFSQVHRQTVDAATFALSAGAASFSQTHRLALDTPIARLAADQGTFWQRHLLETGTSQIALSAETATFSVTAGLVVNGAQLSLAADTATFAQNHRLAVNEALMSFQADVATFTVVGSLGTGTPQIALTAATATFSQTHRATVDTAQFTLLADTASFKQGHKVVIADALHKLSADQATFTVRSGLILGDPQFALSAAATSFAQLHRLVGDTPLMSLAGVVADFRQHHRLATATGILSLLADSATFTSIDNSIPPTLNAATITLGSRQATVMAVPRAATVTVWPRGGSV